MSYLTHFSLHFIIGIPRQQKIVQVQIKNVYSLCKNKLSMNKKKTKEETLNRRIHPLIEMS